MSERITISDLSNFDRSFGEVGFRCGPRTGQKRRSKADMEWYVARRFLKAAINAGRLNVPFIIRQGNPPTEPDFVLKCKTSLVFLEITEATCEADQKEMTAFEASGRPAVLLGEFGGRFKNGGANPERAWAGDIIDAILRKMGKSIFKASDSDRHLVIYPNSNASSLICDAEDELSAAQYLKAEIVRMREEIKQAANGCRIHVLGKECLFYNVMDEFAMYKMS